MEKTVWRDGCGIREYSLLTRGIAFNWTHTRDNVFIATEKPLWSIISINHPRPSHAFFYSLNLLEKKLLFYRISKNRKSLNKSNV